MGLGIGGVAEKLRRTLSRGLQVHELLDLSVCIADALGPAIVNESNAERLVSTLSRLLDDFIEFIT